VATPSGRPKATGHHPDGADTGLPAIRLASQIRLHRTQIGNTDHPELVDG